VIARQQAGPTSPLHGRVHTFCKRVPSLLDYYAAIPSTITLEIHFTSSTTKNPTFSLSRSPTPCARRHGSGRHSTATSTYRGPKICIHQANVNPWTNVQWWEAAESPTVYYPTLASMTVDPFGGASVPVSLRPHGKVEMAGKHQ